MATFNGTNGDDALIGTAGDDTFRPRGGDDKVRGLAGDDTARVNVTTGGSDMINLGGGEDLVLARLDSPGQIRLTFTSSEVGNDDPRDSNTMTNQDGGLAVRLQAEDGSDGLTGPESRYDDEGITFEANSPGVTFDVRDLVSGAQRGDQFEVVRLGTLGGDSIDEGGEARSYYINAGMGDDTVTGSDADDFLVGGAGNDRLIGARGDDTFIGGGGDDEMAGGRGADSFIFNAPLDPSTNLDRISFFNVADDQILLESDVFTGLPPGPLADEAFALTTEQGESEDRILYNPNTGRLLFDADGGDQGNAVAFAKLLNAPENLSADDFLVI